VSTETELRREAQRRYTAAWRRRRSAATVTNDLRNQRGRYRALMRLAAMYPDDYARLREEEARRG